MSRRRRTVIAACILAAAMIQPVSGSTGEMAVASEATAEGPGADSSGALMREADMETGSLQLTLTYSASGTVKKMQGGSIAIFLAAGAAYHDGKWSYDVRSGRFPSVLSGAGIEQMDSETLSSKNASLAASLEKACSNLQPDAAAKIQDGIVSFGNLKAGLYLVLQEESGEGHAINPFLISIPDAEGNMNVTAKPKLGITSLTIHDVPDKPSETESPKPGTSGAYDPSSSGNGNSSAGRLPQTGQLWWPVPVLSACGIVLILSGETLRRRQRTEAAKGRQNNES